MECHTARQPGQVPRSGVLYRPRAMAWAIGGTTVTNRIITELSKRLKDMLGPAADEAWLAALTMEVLFAVSLAAAASDANPPVPTTESEQFELDRASTTTPVVGTDTATIAVEAARGSTPPEEVFALQVFVTVDANGLVGLILVTHHLALLTTS
jgi:hypothetical protein